MLFNWMGLVGNFSFMLLYVAIWNTLLRDDPSARLQMLAYVFITRLLEEFHWVDWWEIQVRFEKGDVGLELIKPLAFPLRLLADWFGRSLFRAVRALPAFLLVGWLMGVPWPAPGQFGLFLVSSLLSWVVHCAIWLCFGLVALWTTKMEGADHLIDVLFALFSGSFLPFWYLPPAVAAIAPYTPFAGAAFTPAALYTGALTGAAALQAIGLQVVWVLVFCLGIALEWHAGSRKLVIQGG